MSILFKCNFQETILTAEFNPEYNSKEVEIYIEDNEISPPQGISIYLDLNTAIYLRKHLGREIGKLRNAINE